MDNIIKRDYLNNNHKREFKEVVEGGYVEVNIPEDRGKRLQKKAKIKANKIMKEVESEMKEEQD